MILYFVGYFLIRNYSSRKILFLLSALSILYAVTYLTCLDLWVRCVEDDPFQYIFYCAVFIFGILLADWNDAITYAGLRDWGLLFLSVVVIYGHKYLMVKDIAPSFQFIQQLFIFPLIYYCLKISRSGLIQKHVMAVQAFSKPINYVGNMTSVEYCVHFVCEHLYTQTEARVSPEHSGLFGGNICRCDSGEVSGPVHVSSHRETFESKGGIVRLSVSGTGPNLGSPIPGRGLPMGAEITDIHGEIERCISHAGHRRAIHLTDPWRS